MLIRPSFHTGFAQNAAESAYPELWQGLTGAWFPMFGGFSFRNISSAGGSIIKDLSGHNRDMWGENVCTITTNGGFGIEATGTSFGNWSTVADHGEYGFYSYNGFTVIADKWKTDATNRSVALFGSSDLVSGNFCRMFTPSSTGDLIFDFGGNTGNNRVTVGGLTYGNDVWAARAGRQGMFVWQNGQLVGTNGNVAVDVDATSSYWTWNGQSANSDLAIFRFMLVYNCEIGDDKIQFLTRYPWAPFVKKAPVNASLATGGMDLEHDIEQTLNLTEDVIANWEMNFSASSAITFAEDIDVISAQTHNASAESILDFDDLAGPDVSVESSSELSFVDFVESAVLTGDVHNLFDDLGLTDSVEGDNASVQEVLDELFLTDELSFIGPQYVSTNTILSLDDGAVVSLGMPWLPIEVEDTLAFVSQVSRVREFSITDMLNFIQEGYRVHRVTDTLTLSQSMEYGKGPANDPEHELDFEDDVQLTAIWVRSIEHDNFLQDAVTFYKDSPCARKTYNIYSGDGPGSVIPPKPLLSTPNQFTLESILGEKQIVVLRNPETDDRDRLGMNRINRETRGGELNVYSDPVWPKVNTLLFTFTALKRTQLDELQSFMLSTLGQEVKIHDWSGRVWVGVITTPQETAVEDGENAWTISFEFEGEPYDGLGVDEWLGLEDEVSWFIPI